MLGQVMPSAHAQSNFAYYGLEPDIVTNFLGPNAVKLGFVRATVELMLEDADYIEAIEHHSPLLRATIIEIIGRQPKDKVKSLTGREDIRRVTLETLRTLMEKETGKPMIKDILITKFIVQGGQ
ncbi:flagellar basal body-associated protein FliL [Aliiglaciecola sp. LCG003]|uniref:flagellar basal body-associated protein FliL n=1 Tax=Aliiglaciecola sp. LCG003 TaxID=3053655 RepID=UPI002572F0B4|nr:flagellar basal body-associated protein FliL [Aliiglaciecola sp. LCG003]WJG11227.1 flagellar basal body-associated protein FliL [Aliiglaciecola sp. LCG003]